MRNSYQWFKVYCFLSVLLLPISVQAQGQTITVLDVLKDISEKNKIVFHIDERVKLDRQVHSANRKKTPKSIEKQLSTLLKSESYIVSYNDSGEVKEIFILPKGQDASANMSGQLYQLDTDVNETSDSNLESRNATNKYVSDNKSLVEVLESLSADPIARSPRLIRLDAAGLQQQIERYANKSQQELSAIEAIRFPLGEGLDFEMKPTEINTEENMSTWYGQTISSRDNSIEQKIVDLFLHDKTYFAGQITLNERVFRLRPLDNSDNQTQYVLYEVAVETLPPVD